MVRCARYGKAVREGEKKREMEWLQRQSHGAGGGSARYAVWQAQACDGREMRGGDRYCRSRESARSRYGYERMKGRRAAGGQAREAGNRRQRQRGGAARCPANDEAVKCGKREPRLHAMRVMIKRSALAERHVRCTR